MNKENRERGSGDRNNSTNPGLHESVKNKETRDSFKDSAATQVIPSSGHEKEGNQKKDVNNEVRDSTDRTKHKEGSKDNGMIRPTDSTSEHEVHGNDNKSHIKRLRDALHILQEEISHLDKPATTVI